MLAAYLCVAVLNIIAATLQLASIIIGTDGMLFAYAFLIINSGVAIYFILKIIELVP